MNAQITQNRGLIGDSDSVSTSGVLQEPDNQNSGAPKISNENDIGETANEYEQKINEASAAEV